MCSHYRALASIALPAPSASASPSAAPPPGTWCGYSRAGEATAFWIPERRWLFDCGCHPLSIGIGGNGGSGGNGKHGKWKRPHCVFVTHTHADHVAALAAVLLDRAAEHLESTGPASADAIRGRRRPATPAPTLIYVYVPAAAAPAVRAHLRAYRDLIRDDDDGSDDDSDKDDGDRDTDTETNGAAAESGGGGCASSSLSPPGRDGVETRYAFRLCPVEFRREYALPHQGGGGATTAPAPTSYVVRAVECDHRKACAGYSLFQRRQILKPEYRSLSGPELGQLARTGGAALKEAGPLEPVLCFLGDTTDAVFDRHPEILVQHSVVAVECTYYDPADLARAVRGKHLHWTHLRPIVEEHPGVLFLLQHFSLKHSSSEWQRWMRDYNVQSGHYNVHAMLAPPTTTAAAVDAALASTATTTATATATASSSPSCNCFVCAGAPRLCHETSAIP